MKKNIAWLRLSSGFILLIIIAHFCSSEQAFSRQLRTGAKRVIIFGIDGLSTDGIQTANTPNIDRLIRWGAFSLKARGVMPTVSSPNWASMLSGAGPEQHGITSNSWTKENFTIEPTAKDSDGFFPSIFTIMRSAIPDCEMGMFYDWDALANLFNKKALNVCQLSGSYKESFARAVPYVLGKKPDLTFIYSGEPDEVGHEFGHGTPRYYAEIESVDAHIGNFLKAISDAGMYDETNFLLIADHGGVGLGHGGESMDEIQVPWLISGPGIIQDRILEDPLNSYDTSPTIAYLFDVKQPKEWIARPVLGAFKAAEGSALNARSYVPKPKSSLKDGLYTEVERISLVTKDKTAQIMYTTDGGAPGAGSLLYTQSVELDKSAVLKAAAVKGSSLSQVTVVKYVRVEGVKRVTLKNEPSPKYKGEGPLSLFDGTRGIANYRHKSWMGFEGDDLEVTVDFGMEREIRKAGPEFLQDKAAWIFLPEDVEFFASEDGSDYRSLGSVSKKDIGGADSTGVISLSKEFKDLKTRYFRVCARNIGKCPPGHRGAGGKAWLFVDEIILE